MLFYVKKWVDYSSKYTYNDKGNTTSITHYDSEGNVDCSYKYTYDDKGNMTSNIKYDSEGNEI